MGTDSNNRYAAPHVWNLVAKVLREEKHRWLQVKELPTPSDDERVPVLKEGMVDAVMMGIGKTAEAFADRFEEDEGFNRLDFLTKCDPVKFEYRDQVSGQLFDQANSPNPGNVEE